MGCVLCLQHLSCLPSGPFPWSRGFTTSKERDVVASARVHLATTVRDNGQPGAVSGLQVAGVAPGEGQQLSSLSLQGAAGGLGTLSGRWGRGLEGPFSEEGYLESFENFKILPELS